MRNPQIVFTAPGVAELIEQALPSPGPGEVLVRLHVSTISSGTERANVSGDPNVSIASCGEPARFPRYPGYSSAGEVVETGAGVTRVTPGDRVALFWGSHAAYNCLPESRVVKIEDDDISFSEAALLHIGAFPLAAIRKTRLEIGESAMVCGQGILGQLAVLQLRAAGAVPLIAADPNPAKRKRALELGADYALDPFSPDFADTVRQITHGGVSVAIEVTGSGSGLNTALDCMRKFGRVALLGCTRHSDFSIDYYRKVHGPGISLIGAHTLARPEKESSPGMWTTYDDIAAQLKLISCGRMNVAGLVEEVHSPRECPEIYRRLCEEKSFPVVQFDWSDIE